MTKDPAGNKVAWARFGESVIQMCSTRTRGLEQKMEAWQKANGASQGAFHSHKKASLYTVG